MSEVFRVCPKCGKNVAIDSRHCGICGYDTQDGYPLERRNLPVEVAKVALPVVAGLTGLALRAGWHILRKQLPALAANAVNEITAAPPPQKPVSKSTAQHRTRGRVIRIRSKWAVGDRNGVWKSGEEEHIIEVNE